MYSIVYIRDLLELIPTKWQTENNKSYFPPYCSRSRIENAIKLRENPEPYWKKYTIKHVFGTAATYEQGIKKLEAATEESEIKIDYENVGKKQRYEEMYEDREGESLAKKQRRTYENDSSSDDEYYPSLSNRPELELPSHRYELTNVCATPQSCSSLHTSGEERSSDDDFKNFVKKSVKEIFSKLNRLEKKLQVLQEIITDSNKTSASETESLTGEEDIFPLMSVEEVEDLEMKLEEVTYFKKVVNTLKHIGGTDNYSIVAGALRKVLLNQVAEQYSLAGVREKRCFRDLILYKAILETARYHRRTITDIEFADIVARWLKQAKTRRERAEERKIQKNKTL